MEFRDQFPNLFQGKTESWERRRMVSESDRGFLYHECGK